MLARGQRVLDFAQARLDAEALALQLFGSLLCAREMLSRVHALGSFGVRATECAQLRVEAREPFGGGACLRQKVAQTFSLALKLLLHRQIFFYLRERDASGARAFERVVEPAHVRLGGGRRARRFRS